MNSIPNLRILLAEDNLINQRIAALTFKQIGVSCDIASNGLEAVNKYRESTYDLVFMDLQMPEMDGIEATEKIRELENETNINKPAFIVAITANTTSEKKQICLDSGMNDFVEKPFREESLREIILKASSTS